MSASRHEVYQNLSATGYSVVFGSQTRKVRVACNVNSTFKVVEGADSTTVASATSGAVLAGTAGPDYIAVSPGQKIHAFLSGAGNFSITELSSG